MYAETDFYLALLKEDDWLKENSLVIFNRHNDAIWTSHLTSQELLLYANKYKRDPVELLDSFYGIARVADVMISKEMFLLASHMMARYGTTPFDAMHAAIAKEDGTIISSDSIYDKMGLKRIKLEKP